MLKTSVIIETNLPLALFIKGKVRDTYDLGNYLLIISTDRISAFDVILPDGIPGKGAVLNQISAFWFKKTSNMIHNHVVEPITQTSQLDNYLSPEKRFDYPSLLNGRCMVVKKAKRLPVECVVRGYLAGSGWSEYFTSGSICGLTLPKGLKESEELPEPIFTPTSKAEKGHDMPMTMSEVERLIGKKTAVDVETAVISIYKYARRYALNHGIIIADTKMEFGIDEKGALILIDELLTPDSSRFWDARSYKAGQTQESYDKQPVRDWLTQSGWNKAPPAPKLPDDVINNTTIRYRQAFEKITETELK